MLWFGGDYNPEQWPESVWAEDVELMRAAHVNLVTVGVFAWSSLQPEPGRFEFGWLDRVLDLLDGAGIGVALATPTASPPPWFTASQALPVRRDGVRLTHGSRDTYCVNAPAYQEASRRITAELADRYAGHPAVRLWHVHNEYGTWCFCDHCAAGFRNFLRARHGDVERLNDAWCTAFWSQRYAGFEEILPPRATQYLPNPAHELDYRRFLSESMLTHYLQAREIIKEGSAAPVTTNFVLGGWVPVDHARWAHEVDLVAIDSYPARVATATAERAFAADLARGWARAAGHPDGRWLVMEHAPGTVHEGGVTRRLPPGAIAEAARTYLDRGSIGAMYFQWRASRGGAEQWHPAMVPHGGTESRTFREITATGAEVASREPVLVRADVAVVFDEESMWAWQAPHLPTARLDYTEFGMATHRAAAALGGAVDVIPATAPLDGYRLVCVPAMYVMSPTTHAALREYADRGGTLLVTFGSGLVDETVRVTHDSLADLLGVRLGEPGPLLAGETVALADGGTGTIWCDEIELDGAEVLLRTTAGDPVLTRRGTVYYLGTRLGEEAYAAVIAKIL
jgi:beta-galactosidase